MQILQSKNYLSDALKLNYHFIQVQERMRFYLQAYLVISEK